MGLMMEEWTKPLIQSYTSQANHTKRTKEGVDKMIK